jgi:hypothetical protein
MSQTQNAGQREWMWKWWMGDGEGDGPAAARSERNARKGAATRQGQPGLRGEAE